MRGFPVRLLLTWHFLQDPRVAIGIAEVDELHAPHILNRTHFHTPASERLTNIDNVRYDQMQPLYNPRLPISKSVYPGPNQDRTGRPGRRELDHSHANPRLDIMV